MKRIKLIGIVGIIIIILIIWGLIGSSITTDIGTSCDIGIDKTGSMFCWTWHQNIIGDISNAIDQAFGG
jgi:hypothetical protein